MHEYFYGAQSSTYSFIRVPTVLFTDDQYKYVSAEAKVLYGLLLARMDLSAKNGWLDDQGRVYIICTLSEIMEKLNCADNKATKLMNELEDKCGLIERKRQGLGKPTETPYLLVRRAWHTESNRPIIMTELKTKAARRDIAIPDRLAECLREAKAASTSEYVIANDDGGPLSYSQFKNLWRFIIVRTAKPRIAKKKVGGKYVKYMLYPELGAMAKNNGKVQYVLDFEVTPHQLRHTYITNLIAAGVDPKTVQYLAGHENSKITMDIYAKAKYNRPEDVAPALADAFAMWNE